MARAVVREALTAEHASIAVDEALEDDSSLLQGGESAESSSNDSQQQRRRQRRRPIDAPRRRIEFLDGLRGLAALLVVCQHAGVMDEGIKIGTTAVDIFFVLSAFLLTLLLDAEFRRLRAASASSEQWTNALADYYSKRFLRIYPLYAVTSVLVWCFPRFYGIHDGANLVTMLTLNVQRNYFVFWTLPLEISYYFLIPLFTGLVCLLDERWWLAVAPLGVWAFLDGVTSHRKPHEGLESHISTFVIGSLAAIVFARAEKWMAEKDIKHFGLVMTSSLRVVQASALALMLSLAFHGLLFHWVASNPFKQQQEAGESPFVSLPLSLVVVIEMLAPSVLSQLLEWKLLTYAGKVSFSMYLLHPFAIRQPWIESQETWQDTLFASGALVFLVATAGYWAVEYPAQRLAKHNSNILRENA